MSCVYRRSAPLFLFFASLARAGHEFPARPGEEVAPQQLIVKLRQGVSPASIIPSYIPGAIIEPLRHADAYLVYLPSGTSSSASSQLAAHSLVEFTEPNRLRHLTIQSPNDPQVASQWALSAVQAQQAWLVIPDQYLTSALAGNGTGRIKVAILDSGIDCTHPDFANSGGSSDDAAQGGQILFSASKAPVITTVSPAACAFQDDYGHGTHVAGIVAAATQNATGVASLGFPLELIVYKVLDKSGSGTDTAIANAIVDAVAVGAQVISLSLGGTGYSQTLQIAVNYAWGHNSLVVAAAGNNSSSAVFYPADANFAVGVSATDSNGNLASFSNFGNGISIAAPGVSILSTLPTYANTTLGTQNYGYLSGTSMATPHVSALAGLVSMTTPNTSAAAILERIQQSAASTIVNGGWNQNFGYGIINAYDAVSGTLRPASLGSLAGQVVDASANPINAATIVVNGQSIITNATGLYRFPSLGAGSYSVSVTAAGLPPQSLTAVITPGADTRLQIAMGITYGKFTGAVTDSGSPVAGAVVEALSGGVIAATAFTDINGQYSLWVAGGGTYDLSVSAISKITTIATARSVAAAATSTVNLTMARLGIISGAVRNASQQAIANAQIFLSGPTSTWGAASDANGNYSSIGLPVGTYTVTCSASGLSTSVISNVVVSADSVTTVNCQLGQQVQSAGLGFYPLAQCRAVDTRSGQGHSGAFGPPALSAYFSRVFPISSSNCGIPGSAQAYSLNVTASPPGPLDFLSAWPAGQPYPNVSTLNSPDGSIIANAAIVPSGTNGAITVVTGKPTDLIIDVNGYFGAPNGSELVFYPMTPCRVADTRQGQGKSGAFGPPGLAAYSSRDFPLLSSSCGVPATAKAYSLNMTASPLGPLDFLSTWPAGQPYPNVSTLNSPKGNLIANAAIVPAGTKGAITVVGGNPTDLIIDINGYFAPPGSPGALHFYPVTPCRIVDTRPGQGKSGAFGPPGLAAYSGRDFPVLSGSCGIPPAAQVYSLNVTAAPQGPLDFLSTWSAGQPFPNVSTLNSPGGNLIANAAMVRAGTNGAITVTASNPADLIIDINGYFAP